MDRTFCVQLVLCTYLILKYKTGHEFKKKVSMPAGKRTTMNGKFIELARKKAFQKKEEPKVIFYICPLAIKSMKAVNFI